LVLLRLHAREGLAVPSTKKQDAEEVVMFAARIPKSMKRELLQLALDQDSTVQAIVRSAIEDVLADRAATIKTTAAQVADVVNAVKIEPNRK
jgi:hypothetical protein